MPTVRRVRRTSADDRPRDDEEEERPRRRRREEEDEEEERPRRSRARDDDEEEERPRRRRSRDDDEEEERPRSRRSRDEEDEEDDRPRRGGLSRGRRSSRDDDDDDDRRGRRGGTPANVVRRGWAGYDETRSETSGYGERLEIDRDPKLVKFLEDEPYASFGQHWVDNPPAPFKKKSWICIKKDCPLCDLGDRPRSITYFNVLLMSGGEPEVRSLEIGRTAADSLKVLHEDTKTGPLTKHYFAIRKSGKQQTSNILFSPVKERDFEDDWKDIDPLTDDEFEEYQELCFTEKNIQLPTRKTLEEIADALADE